jgi:cAMP phosphodiesterase
MKLQLLPSTFEPDGSVSPRQHLSCIVIDDRVAVDAGSLAMAATDEHRRGLRDVVLTHAHLDHIAGLPLFVDDLFSALDEPVRIHALPAVIEVLDRDIFNWSVFPKFSELSIGESNAIKYCPVHLETLFRIGPLEFRLFPADHKVPSAGVLVKDNNSSVLISGDTANLSGLDALDQDRSKLSAMLVECAFPDELCEIAKSSHHMTPSKLGEELRRLSLECPVYVFNIKANYRRAVVDQINALKIPNLEILDIGKVYFF